MGALCLRFMHEAPGESTSAFFRLNDKRRSPVKEGGQKDRPGKRQPFQKRPTALFFCF